MSQRRARTGRGWDPAPPRADADPTDAGPTDEKSAGGKPAGGKPVDPAERAREICLRQLAVRPRTRAELAAKLLQQGIPDEVAEAVLERYGEVGMIDDEMFARAWVSSRHHSRGLASRALAGELRRKGVDSDTVGAALAGLDPETEAATARALVDRKLRVERGDAPESLFRRLVAMLARKGYPPGLAIRVVKQALTDWADPAAGDGLDDGVAALDTDAIETELLNAEADAS